MVERPRTLMWVRGHQGVEGNEELLMVLPVLSGLVMVDMII